MNFNIIILNDKNPDHRECILYNLAFYKILKIANQSVVADCCPLVSWKQGWNTKKGKMTIENKKTIGGDEHILHPDSVMTLWVYTYKGDPQNRIHL